MLKYQRTLKQSVRFEGIGIHSGREVHLTVKPAPANHGIKFIRTDLMNKPSISANFNHVVDTSLATVIGENGFIVSTIEHLMATFAGLSIDNAIVELDTHEMPIMDGSAGPYSESLLKAGIKEQADPRFYFVVKEPSFLEKEGKSVSIHPHPTFKITCTIEYPNSLINTQTCSFDISETTFRREIANARTFGFIHEYEYLKRYGLGQGSSLENVIVIDQDRILNPGGLRFSDEFVRHKALDFIGDFSLLGMPILGHVITQKSGHAFNHAFLKKFLRDKNAWETRSSLELTI